MRDWKAIRETFDRDGFVIVPDLISPDKLAQVRRMIDGVVDQSVRPNLPVKIGPSLDAFHMQLEVKVKDDPSVPMRDKIRVVFHMTHTHTYFRDLSRSPEILDAVEALIGPNIRYYTDQMFVKPARHGTEVPWHQDSAYWPDAEPRLLSCWLAIDDVTEENGCVRFLPGTHRAAVRHKEFTEHVGNSIGTSPEIGGFDTASEVPVVMKAGSASFHHSLTLHRSLPNTSDRGRRGLIMIFLPADLKFHRPWNFAYGFQLVRGRS